MKFLIIILVYCLIQSIYGFNVSDHIIFPPDLREPRIVGGQDAPDGLAPFQCSMQTGKRHFCGCAVMNEKWIVTASHCVNGKQPQSIEIMVGSQNLAEPGTYYKTEKYIKHEKHNQPIYANDIALLRVEGSIQFNDKVKPIALSPEEVPDGTELQPTGWGRLSLGGTVPQRLQVIKLKSVSTQRCKEIYNGRNVHDSHICTFTKAGEGACHGDSGGPLIWGDKLVGVVNWGTPCAVGYPDAYAKVSYLYEWVQQHAV